MYSCHYDQQSVFVGENSLDFLILIIRKNKGIDQNINSYDISMRISWNKIFTLKIIPKLKHI